jgi:NADPH:quinone reductase-like Zn-dependent oxidoreductase
MARTTAAFTRLLSDGRLLPPAIERYSLERVAQAHEAVERGTSAKVIVTP